MVEWNDAVEFINGQVVHTINGLWVRRTEALTKINEAYLRGVQDGANK